MVAGCRMSRDQGELFRRRSIIPFSCSIDPSALQ